MSPDLIAAFHAHDLRAREISTTGHLDRAQKGEANTANRLELIRAIVEAARAEQMGS